MNKSVSGLAICAICIISVNSAQAGTVITHSADAQNLNKGILFSAQESATYDLDQIQHDARTAIVKTKDNDTLIHEANHRTAVIKATVAAHSAEIGKNSQAILINSAAAAQNATHIISNRHALALNSAATTLNTQGVSANTTAIKANSVATVLNTQGVTANTTAITANIAGISANRAATVQNAQGVSANATAITSNTQAISRTNTRVDNNSRQLANHEGRITNLENQSNQQFHNLKDTVNNNRQQASAGIAGVAAMANIPQVSQGAEFSVGAGVGNYDGEQGLAVGASARLGKQVVTKFTVSATTQNDFVTGAGMSYEW